MTSSVNNAGVWSQDIARTIGGMKCRLKPSIAKEYQLNMLVRLARRCEQLAPECSECGIFRTEIEKILPRLVKIPLPPVQAREYLNQIHLIMAHFKKAHHLVVGGDNLAIWLGIGLIAGGSIGLGMGDTPVWTTSGLILGLIVGVLLDYKDRAGGRII